MSLTQLAINQSVQEFEPHPNQGAAPSEWFGVTKRGNYLSPAGTRQRDRELRDWDRLDDNTKWRGCRSGVIKKEAALPYEIAGKGTVLIWVNEQWVEVDAVAHFQAVLQYAHFGQGYQYCIKRLMRDYYTQDHGAFLELIGPGDPRGPLMGAVTGIAVLDSLRVFSTGNPDWPFIYFGQRTGKLHTLHHSRVIRFVDMPDGDERFWGGGECALSRYIATAFREMLMSRYIEQRLDDKPQPGIMAASNLTPAQRDAAFAAFNREQRTDERPAWGQTIWLYGIDPANPLSLTPITFSQAPEKFDFQVYSNHDVNELALAFNTDKNEIWELTSGNMGSGQQSEIQAQKARGKVIADFTSMITRAFNIDILPNGLEFKFKTRDEAEDKAQSDKDSAYMGIATQMHSMGDTFSPVEIRSVLADKSETFQQILTNPQGITQAPDENDIQQALVPEVTAPGDMPIQTTPIDSPQLTQKDYPATRASFTANLIDLMKGGLQSEVSRRRFGIVMRAQLRRAGQSAYEDGLKAGGIEEPIDEDGLAEVQGWLGDQSDYVTKFANELFKQGLTPAEVEARSTAWANKSLDVMFNAGRLNADKNGLYEFTGDDGVESCKTCRRLRGQRHRLKDWNKKKLIPRRDTKSFECGGWQCQHQLVRVTGKAMGSW